jgi:two-component sensor histidine kinase
MLRRIASSLPKQEPRSGGFAGGELAQAVFDTVREPLLILDAGLRVVVASSSFYETFAATPKVIVGFPLYEFGNGEWNILKLRIALAKIRTGRSTSETFEVDQYFPSIGQRTLILNARALDRPGNERKVLLAIEDVTERVAAEHEHTARHNHSDMLLQELTHRVKNSLQSIAAIVMIESRNHKSGQGKAALERVSHRIDAVGQLYSKLSRSDTVEAVDAATYLDALCHDLAASVQGHRPVVLTTDIDSELLPSDRAIPIGLVVNELVTNALKYAFPRQPKGSVNVTLKRVAGELLLTVADDGQGIDPGRADSGLGGRLVEGFVEQLGGRLERESGKLGTTVRIVLPAEAAAPTSDVSSAG